MRIQNTIYFSANTISPPKNKPGQAGYHCDQTCESFLGCQCAGWNNLRFNTSTAKRIYRVSTANGGLSLKHGDLKGTGNAVMFFTNDMEHIKKLHEFNSTAHDLPKGLEAPWYDFDSDILNDYFVIPGAKMFKKLTYVVYDKDSKKWDTNKGLGYIIYPDKPLNKAMLIDKKEANQPLYDTISSGTAQGKVVYAPTLKEIIKNEKNNPVIAVVDRIKTDEEDAGAIPSNIKGIIVAREDMAFACHDSAMFRNGGKIVSIIYDDVKFDKFKSLNGHLAEFSSEYSGEPRLEKINKITIDNTKIDKINIPKIKIEGNNQILHPEEYEQDLVGPKAYKLKVLQEAVDAGRVEGVEIPPSFAIPPGIYHDILNFNKISEEKPGSSLNEKKESIINMVFPENITKNIIEESQKLGEGYKMVRSAFNGEDVRGYSAAGLYDSYPCLYDSFVTDRIKMVWTSKWNERAVLSREENKIPPKSIQPTVLVQKRIPADYTFTIYSKDPRKKDNDKVFIELTKYGCRDPYRISYDKKNEKIEIESKMRKGRNIYFNEDLKIIPEMTEKFIDPISKDIENWRPVLQKIGKATQQIENEFNYPQDIEGGVVLNKDNIAGSKVFVWQSRDMKV